MNFGEVILKMKINVLLGNLTNEVYETYIRPNETEFRQNYSENSSMWNRIKYKECALDFVPIADKEYVVIEKDDGRLHGTIALRPYEEDAQIEKSIHSVLIADEWDIRKALPAILEKRWTYVYFVLNEAVSRFASFFKLKEFLAALPPNVKFFATTEEMRQYFLETSGAYLPRKIIAPEPENYERLFKEIHEARIQSGIPSDNVFLSICIPSYNRGSRALKTVQSALTTQFDAEIEVVLVNNGSTLENVDYNKLKDLRDSRLCYCEFDYNGGYEISFCNGLKQTHGHFAYMLSDEDCLIVESINDVLNYLVNTDDVAVCTFPAVNPEEYGHERPQKGIFEKGLNAIKWAHSDLGYFTAICFNMDLMKKEMVLDRLEPYKGNGYFGYIQYILSSLLGAKYNVANSAVKSWSLGKMAEHGGDLDEYLRNDGMWLYEMPEARCEQLIGSMNLVKDILSPDDLEQFFLFRFNSMLECCSYSCKVWGPQYEAEIGSWIDAVVMFYESCIKILRDLELEGNKRLKEKIDRSFFYWLICKRLQKWYTPEENLLPSLQAQVVKYYYDKGIPIQEIDFQGIEEDLKDWVKEFLEKRS